MRRAAGPKKKNARPADALIDVAESISPVVEESLCARGCVWVDYRLGEAASKKIGTPHGRPKKNPGLRRGGDARPIRDWTFGRMGRRWLQHGRGGGEAFGGGGRAFGAGPRGPTSRRGLDAAGGRPHGIAWWERKEL